jgi:predicted aspartyl protease
MKPLTSPLVAAVACGALLAPALTYSQNRLPEKPLATVSSISWPTGTDLIPFENIEGIILLRGTLQGIVPPDTTGPLALDTGAGYLALDAGLARVLGLADSAGDAEAVDLARRALPRLSIGHWSVEQVEPVLTVDGDVVRRVSDRPVLGLLGQRPLGDRVVWIDYREQMLALVPGGTRAIEPGLAASDTALDRESAARGSRRTPGGSPGRAERDSARARSHALLAPTLSPHATAVPFRLLGDGKVLVRGRVSDPAPPAFSRELNLLVDTGATKCVLFEDSLAAQVRHAGAWPALRGLSAPTLIGTVTARIARVPTVELESAGGPLRVTGVDVGVLRSELSQVLSHVTHETIHGLLGYSFLKRFRIALDYPNRVMWLDSIPGYQDDRPNEYCHVGLQLERRGKAVVVAGVVDDSPAEKAGIEVGDQVVALDGTDAGTLDLLDLTRRMEGDPGRSLTLVIRRSQSERTLKLVRRRLL